MTGIEVICEDVDDDGEHECMLVLVDHTGRERPHGDTHRWSAPYGPGIEWPVSDEHPVSRSDG